ncbi:MAG: hypothetical protein AB1420_18875 [Bacillota bacterium]
MKKVFITLIISLFALGSVVIYSLNLSSADIDQNEGKVYRVTHNEMFDMGKRLSSLENVQNPVLKINDLIIDEMTFKTWLIKGETAKYSIEKTLETMIKRELAYDLALKSNVAISEKEAYEISMEMWNDLKTRKSEISNTEIIDAYIDGLGVSEEVFWTQINVIDEMYAYSIINLSKKVVEDAITEGLLAIEPTEDDFSSIAEYYEARNQWSHKNHAYWNEWLDKQYKNANIQVLNKSIVTVDINNN